MSTKNFEICSYSTARANSIFSPKIALSFVAGLTLVVACGCASNGAAEFVQKTEDRESQLLQELEQQRTARTERLREFQQGGKESNKWEIKPIIDPITQSRTCISTPHESKIYHGHNIDLSVAKNKVILSANSLKLVNQSGSGISVDGKPVHEFSSLSNSGELIIDNNHAKLISDLNTGKLAELSFALDDSPGTHKLQYELDGFRESYVAQDSC